MTISPWVIAPTHCRDKSWHRPQDLSFAQTQALIPLHAGELSQAAASMPLALIKQEAEWQLVGVCGLTPGHNLFIKNGQWLGTYQPLWLSTYPFSLLQIGQQAVLTCAPEAGAPADQGEPFFTADEQPAPAVAERLERLKASQSLQQATARATRALADTGLITPWPDSLCQQLNMQLPTLYRVDERALNQLENADFLQLRQALPLAYALNFSLQQYHLLQRLVRINPAPATAAADVEALFGQQDDTISFNF